NATNGNASLVFNEKSDTYIEITDNWTFLPENNGFLWTSEKSGFNHIYHYTNDGKTIKQLTSGNWDISEIIGYDSKRKLVFYTSYEDTPLEKHTYSLKITGKSKKKLTAETGNHHTSFSKT